MKAVILEIKGNEAAALSDDGCILKVKNKKYVIGQVIELENKKRISTRFVIWAATAAAAVGVFGTGAWAYYTPYTYVSLDVNPSIEYTVNRFDRVLSATAVNTDAENILKDLELTNQPIDTAVKETVDEISKNGYFEGTDPGAIMISTSSDNEQDAQQMADELKTTAETETKDAAVPVEVEAVSVGAARVQQARTLGTTPGKLNLVEKLQASSSTPDSIDVQEWLNRPVKEIMKAIKQNRKDAGNVSSEPSDSSSSSEASSQSSESSTPSVTSGEASSQSSESSAPSVTSSKASSESSAKAAKAQAKAASKNNGQAKTSTSSVISSSAPESSASESSDVSSQQNGKSAQAQQKPKNDNNGKGKK
ncbi:anti-sigma factor domain-containing protein [Faecalispora anaeroviscerum]|uniref:anti-sigma factor domain-containing protein n=1 Tax=Faecalispora anaeroviscerum TaxID=2991836 RepID=UPI0024B8E488|nr:anti-sigma factor domain-containing protein [Faecalispora anaeroviscerum]